MSQFENILLIVNPQAGGGRGKKWAPRLKDALSQKGLRVQVELTEHSGSAAEAVQRYPCDLIIVAAGDGTFHDAINGLWQGKLNVPIALVPIGTGNVFAVNVGIPFRPLEALELLLNGQVRRLDLGEANGRVFHSIMSVGFDAYVAAKVEPEGKPSLSKRLFGKLAYIAEAFHHSVRYQWSHIQIDAELPDGEKETWERDTWVTLVSNMPAYAGGFKITPDAKPDDGLLDLCLFPAQSKLDYYRFAALGILGLHLRHPQVIYRQIRFAKIESEPPAPTQLDGEIFSPTPIVVRALPNSLPVLLPQ